MKYKIWDLVWIWSRKRVIDSASIENKTYTVEGCHTIFPEKYIGWFVDEWTPKEGEKIEVSLGDVFKGENGIFICKDKNWFAVCVHDLWEDEYKKGERYSCCTFPYYRKLDEKKERKLMMTDSEWENVKKYYN